MINLKKNDSVADAVKDILQQEALKGNQDKIDANHNNKIDAEDFKILRGKKKVQEELKGNQDKIDANHNGKIDGQDFKLLRAKKKMKEEAGRTEDCLDGKPKAKKGDDVGPNSDFKSSKVKLKAEEVEQIDELSKDTLGSYLDKKKSEYMKGKTQSGSKENAKDIQNMGKAHDKMTLKKMKESFEEPVLDELISEVMAKDASAGDYIHDFIHSDNPKFAGKSKAKRKEMALAAYYSKKNEETVNEGLKDLAKKSFKALTGGSDKDHLDRLKKDMYGGSEVKYAAKTLVKHAKDPLGLKKEETEQFEIYEEDLIETELMLEKNKPTQPDKWASAKAAAKSKFAVYPSAYANAWASKKYKSMGGGWRSTKEEVELEEGWDDMVKDAKEKVASGPKPSGGSGKKEGSRYGGSKQKEKPEQEVKEAKDPTMDAGCGSAPNFATNDAKPMKAAQAMAKKSLARMRSEMLGKTGTSE